MSKPIQQPTDARRPGVGVRATLVLATLLLAVPALGAEIIKVRVGNHPTFTRLVFELDRPAGYRVEKKGTKAAPELVVTVDASSRPRSFTSRSDGIAKVDVKPDADSSVARISLRKQGRIKEMILANPPRIVLDVMREEVKVAVTPPAPKPKVAKTPAPAVKPEPKVAKPAPTPTPAPKVAKTPTPAVKPEPKTAKPAPAVKPEPKIAKPVPAVKPEPKIAKPAPTPTPEPKIAKPAPTPTPEPKIAKPAPAPTPEPKIAKPAPAPTPEPKIAKPAPTPTPEPKIAKPAPAPTPEPKIAKPAPTPGFGRDAKPAAPKAVKPKAPETQTADSSSSGWLSNPLVMLGGGGLLLLVVGLVLMRRRRPLPNNLDVTAIAESDRSAAPDSPLASSSVTPSPLSDLFDDDESEATTSAAVPGEVSQASDAALDDLFGDAQVASEPTGDAPMNQPMSDLPADPNRAGSPPSPPAAAGAPGADSDVLRVVHELERRMAQLETKLEESNEARDRLERQVAAQSEELRVQRAAIARTQRALRTMSRGDEDKATEPALRNTDGDTQTKTRVAE